MTIPDVADQRQRPRRRVGGVLRRDDARRQDDRDAHGRARPARLVPAVEYLQSQRLRMMMMTELAAATKGVDVYLVASNAGRRPARARPRRRPGRSAAAGDPAAARRPARAQAAAAGAGGRGGGAAGAARAPGADAAAALAAAAAGSGAAAFDDGESRVLSGDQRAERLHRRRARRPTSRSSRGRSAKMELLALAKAYQDAAGHHLKKPTKLDG